MSMEDRDYFHEDRDKRLAAIEADSRRRPPPRPPRRQSSNSGYRGAKSSNTSMVPPFVAGLAIGVFGTIFVMGLLSRYAG